MQKIHARLSAGATPRALGSGQGKSGSWGQVALQPQHGQDVDSVAVRFRCVSSFPSPTTSWTIQEQHIKGASCYLHRDVNAGVHYVCTEAHLYQTRKLDVMTRAGKYVPSFRRTELWHVSRPMTSLAVPVPADSGPVLRS